MRALPGIALAIIATSQGCYRVSVLANIRDTESIAIRGADGASLLEPGQDGVQSIGHPDDSDRPLNTVSRTPNGIDVTEPVRPGAQPVRSGRHWIAPEPVVTTVAYSHVLTLQDSSWRAIVARSDGVSFRMPTRSGAIWLQLPRELVHDVRVTYALSPFSIAALGVAAVSTALSGALTIGYLQSGMGNQAIPFYVMDALSIPALVGSLVLLAFTGERNAPLPPARGPVWSGDPAQAF